MKKTVMLRKNYEFKKVLSKGKYYSGQYLEAVILQKPKSRNALGIAINSKIGTAVVRNRLKRLFRESYYSLEESIKEGQAIVFLWKKNAPIDSATYQNIKKDMELIFDKANILSKEN